MTPLAQSFFRQLALPIKERTVSDLGGVLDKLEDLHCFEMTAVSDAVNGALDEAIATSSRHMIEASAKVLREMFLPSPQTWLEADHPGLGRTAVLIEAAEAGRYRLRMIVGGEPICTFQLGTFAPPGMLEIDMAWNAQAMVTRGFNDQYSPEQRQHILNRIICETVLFIDIINTPGLVGLRTHAPHRGLERALRRSGVGRYPLRAWSEVVIKPGPVEAGPDDHETHLTGRKCLHFVRAHRRHFRDGSKTIVSHHWRGDPALGIKRTRYRVDR